ncbi:unnamed protein product [Cylicocyclus nassatus]|uniref:Uncharacterized protein n=1 Tax=Cylicocyclus nassatus TaxID=53992 RepID=A0AA36M8S9_CYLNA|nr:unnamed protein product [Cylicocyclus nassatus]
MWQYIALVVCITSVSSAVPIAQQRLRLRRSRGVDTSFAVTKLKFGCLGDGANDCGIRRSPCGISYHYVPCASEYSQDCGSTMQTATIDYSKNLAYVVSSASKNS